MAKQIILETNFNTGAKRLGVGTGKWAKRLGGERERGRNDFETNGKVGETTRGERESGRNDPGASWKVGETTRIQTK